jgi:Zn-dependent membrane protease YugP
MLFAYLMFGFFDPLYLLLLAPGMLLGMWAQWRVSSAFSEGQRYRSPHGMTGAQAAREVLRAAGVAELPIEPIEGQLSDHYDPSAKVLRLSPDVYYGQTLSAVGVAAHEAGHAIQDATGYPLLVLRNAIVPLASLGGNLSWIMIMGGIFLMYMGMILGQWVMLVGIGLFGLTVVFQLVNLPVEFDASRRARLMLVNHAIISEQQDVIVGKVLSAAAMTYVAATLTAVMTLIYFIIRSGILNSRR